MEHAHAENPIPPLLRQSGPAIWHLGPEHPWTPADGPRVLIGGVGYWWQRDASFGLAAVDALSAYDWPPGVRLAKLDYGALYVAQDLLDVQPAYDRLVLLAGTERERTPGRLYEHRWLATLPDPEEIQARVYESGAGVIDVDHLLIISEQFGALPSDVLIIEVEPIDAGGGEAMTAEVTALLPKAVDRARRAALAPFPTRRPIDP